MNELAQYARKAYRLDFLNLLLCMAVGHLIIDNPFFGAAVYLFADIIKAYHLGNMASYRHSDGAYYRNNLVYALIILGGVAVAFVYPLINRMFNANYVSLFAASLVLRDYFGAVPISRQGKWLSTRYYVTTAIIHILFDASVAFLLWQVTQGWNFIGTMVLTVVTGVRAMVLPEYRILPENVQPRNRYEKMASYKMLSSMNLYSTIAVNLGVMVYFFHMIMPLTDGFDMAGYGWMIVWLIAVLIVLIISSLLIGRRGSGLALAEFVTGGIAWILGIIFIYTGHSAMSRLVWTSVWGISFALISVAIRKFYTDFEMVGSLVGEEYDREALAVSNTIEGAVASIISSAIMLVVMAVWTFIAHSGHDAGLVRLFDIIVMQMPAVFMLVAVILALKHPLDYRNREKLLTFMQMKVKNESMRKSLEDLFVPKYRMRFGVKILMTLARPFLRLKVSGKEHLRSGDYPSVFVSNHNFIYGPIAAVIYLPTYFRPWIHNVMLQKDTAREEIARPFAVVRKIFGKKAGNAILALVARMTCWALNSFNPIPVVRGNSRDVMSTFQLSLKALEEGDNILIFPEKPKSSLGIGDEVGHDVLRTFYTGFSHIAKMYYDRTGKSLLFYPLYSDLNDKAFRIGEPVMYDASLDSHESKRLLAEELQHRIEALSD